MTNEPIGNDRIEDVLGHVNKRSTQVKRWVLEHNGIESRHYAIDPQTGKVTHTNAQMTAEAVRAAVEQAGVGVDEIECLVCGTSLADQLIPSHACTTCNLHRKFNVCEDGRVVDVWPIEGSGRLA